MFFYVFVAADETDSVATSKSLTHIHISCLNSSYHWHDLSCKRCISEPYLITNNKYNDINNNCRYILNKNCISRGRNSLVAATSLLTQYNTSVSLMLHPDDFLFQELPLLLTNWNAFTERLVAASPAASRLPLSHFSSLRRLYLLCESP